MSPRMLESGISNLDRILGGGIPEGDIMLIMGPPGSGKTTMCFQVAFQVAKLGKSVVYVSTLAEPPARLIKHQRSFSFFDESLLGRRLALRNIYPSVKQGIDSTIDALISTVREQRAELLILDGLDTVRDLHTGKGEIRLFIYELAVALTTLGCTTIVTSAGMVDGDGTSTSELTMSDGIVVLGDDTVGTHIARTVQAQKMRGVAPLLGLHSMRIDGDGVAIFPRVESLVTPFDNPIVRERLPTGLPELDLMASGGLMPGSVTLLAGAPGTGKTLLGLQYIVEGARRGEKGLIVGFRESPKLLIEKMRGFGWDLETPVNQGLITILHQVPIDLNVDEIFANVMREIIRIAPRRLVVDSVAEIEHAVDDERRRRTVMVCFAELTRARGVTALLTREMSQVTGPELDFSDTPLAVLGENLILLRYVELGSELYRILSVLKMRDAAHDRSIRQYEIGGNGLRILKPIESAEGILTGIARLPSERRVKRPHRTPPSGVR